MKYRVTQDKIKSQDNYKLAPKGDGMIEQAIQWLKDGGEESAAAILSDCELDLLFVDLAFELGGERELELYDVNIAAPCRILDGIEESYSQEKEQIEQAIKGLAQSNNWCIRDIVWVPKLPSKKSPVETEVSEQLLTVNSEHLRRAWEKALRRKSEDPEGAITAARTLVETVCKHILDEEQIAYPNNADLPNLYRLVVEQLHLAPEQYTEGLIRKILGSCQSVVGAIAALRNQLGDAHGKRAEAAIPHPLLAELAVNLAGAMAKYLLAV